MEDFIYLTIHEKITHIEIDKRLFLACLKEGFFLYLSEKHVIIKQNPVIYENRRNVKESIKYASAQRDRL